MPLSDKDDHHEAATVEELLHDLVEDTIHALPAGLMTHGGLPAAQPKCFTSGAGQRTGFV